MKMKKPILILLAILISSTLMLGLFLGTQALRKCDLETDLVCYNDELKRYEFEEGASLVVEVDNAEYGLALEMLWNTTYPDHPDRLKTLLMEEEGSKDIQYVGAHEAALQYDQLYALNEFEFNRPDQISSELNVEGKRFLAYTGEGFVFLTNKTKLEELGYPWVDANNNYLHDEFESFEKMLAQSETLSQSPNSLVLALNDRFSFYPYLTAYGWNLFESYSSFEPGIEKEEFLNALMFIERLSTVNWEQSDANLAEDYVWDYPLVMANDQFVFSQASNFMYLNEWDGKHASEWVVSVFPKAEESSTEPLRPLLHDIKGYVLSKDVQYPSLAHEVMSFLSKADALQVYVDTHTDIPLANLDVLSAIEFKDERSKQFAYAYQASITEPLIAIQDYPQHLAFALYYDIDVMEVVRRLWNKELTPREAQIEFAILSDQWVNAHSKLFEGKIDVKSE